MQLFYMYSIKFQVAISNPICTAILKYINFVDFMVTLQRCVTKYFEIIIILLRNKSYI